MYVTSLPSSGAHVNPREYHLYDFIAHIKALNKLFTVIINIIISDVEAILNQF